MDTPELVNTTDFPELPRFSWEAKDWPLECVTVALVTGAHSLKTSLKWGPERGAGGARPCRGTALVG